MIIIIEFSVLKRKLRITPTRMIAIGFMPFIALGTLLLNLPVASSDGQSVGFINAVFTATSAVCVNGLVVVDTATQWSAFGQSLIALMMQIGGLGIMTMSTLLALIMGRRITLKERLLIQESLNQFDLEGLVRLTKSIIIAAFAIELIGAVLFSIEFIPVYGAYKGILYGIFHSIAALCNSGFDLIGDYRSFTQYTNNFIININTMLLIIIGGLGFSVWVDTYQAIKERSIRSITLHSKVVLTATVFLILSGAIFLFILEMGNANTMKHLPLSGKILASFFHSITSRTAGFSTLDMTAFTSPSKFMLIIMMFIGGSPSSMAGGIKTTTAAILVLTIVAVVKGKEDPVIFERHLPKYLVYRAMAVTAISLGWVVFVTMVLSITENADFLTLFFEATSAFSTTGLTLNFTPKLSPIGKLIISVTMFAGRVGPLTLVLAFAQRASRNKGNLKYPEDRIMVG